jgi:hypothetical protein
LAKLVPWQWPNQTFCCRRGQATDIPFSKKENQKNNNNKGEKTFRMLQRVAAWRRDHRTATASNLGMALIVPETLNVPVMATLDSAIAQPH